MNLNIPIDAIPINAGAPATTNGGITGSYLSLSNALRAWLVVQLTQAVGFAEVISLTQATNVAGAGVKAGPSSKVWANEDVVASDAWVRKPDGAAYTTLADVKNKLVIIEVDPLAFDAVNDFYVAGWTASNSSQATDIASALWFVQPRYPQAANISAVVN